MSAPDPKVVALVSKALTDATRRVDDYSHASIAAHVAAVLSEHFRAEADARVAAVVEPVLALADEWEREARRPMFGSDDVARAVAYDRAAKAARAAVESTDAPAALARIKAEAAVKALRELAARFRTDAAEAWGHSRPWVSTGGHIAELAATWCLDDADRIEAEAGGQDG